MSSYARDREIYLQENRYENPKEIFKHLVQLAGQQDGVEPHARVCDVGCAAGEFLHYFLKQNPESDCFGFDHVSELVEKARSMTPGARFEVGSIFDTDIVEPKSQDIVFMSGVHSSLPDIRAALDTLVGWTRPGGRIFVFGMFNPHPIDVVSQYRPAGKQGEWTQFHIHSRAGVSDHLEKTIGSGKHLFMPFSLDVDVAPKPDDPFRSWTLRDEHGSRLLTNGLSMLIRCDVLEIRP